MLAKILKDMWVEPEVLEALSEEQKRILFLKMREEQVRRWRQLEEMEERDGGRAIDVKAKTGYRKHVTWLLGRDGDVSVSVIGGDADEFRPCRILQSLVNRVHGDTVRGVQTEEPRPGGEARRLHSSRDIQLSLTDVDDEPSSPDEDANDSSTNDDDPADPGEGSGGGSSQSDCSSLDEQGDSFPLYRPHLRDHGNRPRPNAQQPPAAEESGKKDRETVRLRDKRCGRGGRVAELRKAFAHDPVPVDSAETPSPPRAARSHRSTAPLLHWD